MARNQGTFKNAAKGIAASMVAFPNTYISCASI